jgi:hypothetical protein
MFWKSKRQIKNVMFVQPLKDEAYFYTPIGYSINLPNSKEKGKQVFDDSSLALAGKLKLIFEREKMTWFEIREEKSPTPAKDEHCFVLYYYPHRLVASRTSSLDEKATLQDIRKLFDFIVTEDQTRFAEVKQMQSPSAYGSIAGEAHKESESISIVAKDQIKDIILQTVKKEKPETAKQLTVIMQQRYSVPPEQTNNLLIELEKEDLLHFTSEEQAKGALT